jgi:hypothetical protein
MQFYHNTILIASMVEVSKVLKNEIIVKPAWFLSNFRSEKIALSHESSKQCNSIRLWKTYVVLDCWYNDFRSSEFIGALDYTIKDDFIKIEYLNTENHIFTSKESRKLKSDFIEFLKDIAKRDNKNKIVIDVHENLRIFKQDYECEGFIVTNRRCPINSYWIETELLVK